MVLKLKTLILRLKIWKTKTKLSKAGKVKKITEHKEYRCIIRDITDTAKYGQFSIERKIISDSTVNNLRQDGFDVRHTNFSNIYVISWRTIK
jgi:hypothetical protein